ncbi:unnamed protein product [Ectocarpus sp. CCAP 1310/34]|nr:unnamed protein product [Ectocarpus sp. CCAP 1310/34]
METTESHTFDQTQAVGTARSPLTLTLTMGACVEPCLPPNHLVVSYCLVPHGRESL